MVLNYKSEVWEAAGPIAHKLVAIGISVLQLLHSVDRAFYLFCIIKERNMYRMHCFCLPIIYALEYPIVSLLAKCVAAHWFLLNFLLKANFDSHFSRLSFPMPAQGKEEIGWIWWAYIPV